MEIRVISPRVWRKLKLKNIFMIDFSAKKNANIHCLTSFGILWQMISIKGKDWDGIGNCCC